MKLLAVLFLVLPHATLAAGCVTPTGIDLSGDEGTLNATLVDLALQRGPLWPRVIFSTVPAADTRETPVQFRFTAYVGIISYGTTAAFHPTALNAYGDIRSSKAVRRCRPDEDDPESMASFRRYEEVATMFAVAHSLATFLPESEEAIRGIFLNDFGFDFDLLSAPSASDPTTSWGLVVNILDQVVEYSKFDGWNADGFLSNPFNPMPFEDFTLTDSDGDVYPGYTTSTPGFNPSTGEVDWHPLLEADGRGFLLRQEHVVPHIGYTARLYGLNDREKRAFEDVVVGPPEDYGYTDDYVAEAEYVVDQTRQLATNETKKMLVEFFDGKFRSIAGFVAEYFFRTVPRPSNFEFWKYDVGLLMVSYQSTVLVWREKVRYNRVRPTTVVNSILAGQDVTSYAKIDPTVETTYDGKYWEPYIRTMPHAEYPSASACLCRNTADYIDAYIEQLGLPPGPPMTVTFPAGSSVLEPGITPAEDLSVTFNSWDEISEGCSQSRLWGGMHFEGAVPAGEDLCKDLFVQETIEKLNWLEDGREKGALVNLKVNEVDVRPQ